MLCAIVYLYWLYTPLIPLLEFLLLLWKGLHAFFPLVNTGRFINLGFFLFVFFFLSHLFPHLSFPTSVTARCCPQWALPMFVLCACWNSPYNYKHSTLEHILLTAWRSAGFRIPFIVIILCLRSDKQDIVCCSRKLGICQNISDRAD